MALYYHLPVYKDMYQLLLKIYDCTRNFGKEYKYTLGESMKRDALVLVKCLYKANKAANKRHELELFMEDFELLKLQIRLAVDIKAMPIKQQAELSVILESIGKQISGWHNSQPT